jgi:hypothetical protein
MTRQTETAAVLVCGLMMLFFLFYLVDTTISNAAKIERCQKIEGATALVSADQSRVFCLSKNNVLWTE